jgi:hypothetical protein
MANELGAEPAFLCACNAINLRLEGHAFCASINQFEVFMVFAETLKRIPGVLSLKRSIYCHFGWGDIESGSTRVKLLEVFRAYAPNSAGGYKARAALTISTIKNIFLSIENLVNATSNDSCVNVLTLKDPEDFAACTEFRDSSMRLGGMFNHYRSDKAKAHNYHLIYGPMQGHPENVNRILEIGLGTNNDDVVSTMGSLGTPGASLRAFRDYCPNAMIFGADIDTRILFQEDRICTYQVDQLSAASLANLGQELPEEFDLVIDDGLHSPDANINTLAFAIKLIRKGGWIVIEDISQEAVPIWQCVATLLNGRGLRPLLFQAHGGIVFAVQKL